ncbi:MAG TPA: 30S ribosomal protein S15 [Nanoarchaeota archaeon]|nr:30S ribosomal protein S15 [Nanoarchaeota archaeon]
MAKMYSRRRGKAGSKRPSNPVKPIWVPYKPKEIEQLVVKLAKAEHTPSQIGLVLRDAYGIPSVKSLVEKKMVKILKENNAAPALPENLSCLIKKHIQLMKHIEENKKDETAKRGELITQSKINKLAKYYKKKGALPKTWEYDKAKAKLLVG